MFSIKKLQNVIADWWKTRVKHCNLWTESKARDDPGIVPGENVDFILDSQYIPMDDFLENF
jgi:hypothetical protein